MKERFNEKIAEISEYLQNIQEACPNNLEVYRKDWKAKAICERLCEKIAEAVVDLAFMIFKEELSKDKNIKIPKNDSEVFDALKDRKIITQDLCRNLVELKGMRNWLAHKYSEIIDEIIFNAVSEELPRDIKHFLNVIEEYAKEIKE